MAIIKMSTYNKASGEGVEKREPSYTVGGKVNWCSHYGEPYGVYVKIKLKVELPHDPAIPLDTYLEEMKTLFLEFRKIHTPQCL